MNVARIVDRRLFELQMRRADQERMHLIASRRAMRPDLIVERDDLISVIRAENRDVSGIGLLHEMLHCTDHVRARSIRLERIVSLHHLEPPLRDYGAPGRTLQMDRRSIPRSEQTDARMREQLVVQVCPTLVPRDIRAV